MSSISVQCQIKLSLTHQAFMEDNMFTCPSTHYLVNVCVCMCVSGLTHIEASPDIIIHGNTQHTIIHIYIIQVYIQIYIQFSKHD